MLYEVLFFVISRSIALVGYTIEGVEKVWRCLKP